MNRIFTLTVALLLCAFSSHAVLKTWTGATNTTWSTAGNWNPAGQPGINDTALFNLGTSFTVTVDAGFAANIAGLQVTNGTNVTLDAGGARTFNIDNGGSASLFAVFVQAGSTLQLGGMAAVNLNTFGFSANRSEIRGSLVFRVASAWTVNQFPTQFSTVNIYGSVSYANLGTNGFSTGTTTSLLFRSGSNLLIQRNSTTLPTADFQNGSTINFTGITSNVGTLSNSSIYSGLIIWNCTGQTATPSIGGGANFIGSSMTIDSLRIVSTGTTGILRGNTEIQGVSIGNLEIDGGIFEIASPRSLDRTLNITGNLEVTGGTLFISATDANDNGVKESVTVTVGGNLTISSGTLNLCNRTNGTFSTYSTGNIICNGTNVIQSGGLITETGDIPPISDASYISLSGTTAQNLALTNWNNEVRLLVNNTNGVNLQSHITCPEFIMMNTAGAYLVLGNYHFTATHGRISINTNAPNPARMVTNGTGHYRINNVASGATVTYPVTTIANSIDFVRLRNNDITANTFDVRVAVGNNPGGIFNTNLTVNRTWIINAANTFMNSNPVDLTFIYPNTALNPFCNRSGAMELGHFVTPSWHVDPVGPPRTPSLGASYDTTGTFAPNTLDSAFVLGNQFSILNILTGITLNYFKGNKRGTDNILNWAVNCTSNQAKFEIQRSGNGINFTTIANITASFDRCLQPFDFTDNSPLAGLNYYRIKITDVDGTVNYSIFVLLQNKACAPGGLAMVPTLVNRPQAVVCLDATAATPLQFVITDINGRLVQTIKETAANGQNQFTLNLERLAPGLYYLAAYGSSQKWTAVRFVKL